MPAEVLRRFGEFGRELSTLTVIRHTRIAEQMGLSGTDHKVLELAGRVEGPLTAGRIAQLAGLSTGAVTGVIDRLEQAGFVRRIRSTADRRKVLVELVELDEERFAPLFAPAVELTERVLEQFSPAERAVLTRYMEALLAQLRAETLGS